MAALAYAVTASLRGTKYADLRTLLRERILRPIGASDDEWSIGYGETYNVDGLPLVANWGGGDFTARAVARVGRLMLQRGNWDGRQLVDPGWVDRVTAYAGMPLAPRPPGNPQPPSGLGWWLNSDGVWPHVPRDAFSGAGAGQQVLLVAPSLELIIVRNGGAMSAPSEPEKFWGGIEKYVFNPVLDALNGYSPETGLRAAAPYPPSRVIRGVKFAPKSEIVRRAEGSDNWPLTWADDGNLYAAYGDGWGFEPRVPQKLSLGFARIGGGPDGFEAVNIRTASGEQTGQGEAGKKASGMLAVDGRLYLWARNAGNSQLAWSDDHGATWSWAPVDFHHQFRPSHVSQLRRKLQRGARRLRLCLLARPTQRLPGGRPHGAGAGSQRPPHRPRPCMNFWARWKGPALLGAPYRRAHGRIFSTADGVTVRRSAITRRPSVICGCRFCRERRRAFTAASASTMRPSRGDPGPLCFSPRTGMSGPARMRTCRRNG